MATLGSTVLSVSLQTVSLFHLQNHVHLGIRALPSKTKGKGYGFCQQLRTMATPLPSESIETNVEKSRPLAYFEPDAWGDYFIDYSAEDKEIHAKKKDEHRLLQDELGRELLKTSGDPIEFLNSVDAFELLGVAYHFDTIIEETLQQIYNSDNICIQMKSDLDIYHTSLMFRILRQHRYYVSSDVFKRFLDEQGSFLESLKDDPMAMLCLYEAAHVRAHGEDILEKALEFTKEHLDAITDAQPKHPMAEKIMRSLRYPIQRGVPRLESRHHISFYEQSPCHNKSLLRFAKLDFDLLQSLYKEELKEITRWKQSFNLDKKFPFARMRMVEAYFFSMGTYYEPNLSDARKIYTKGLFAIGVLDDIYDAFGTLDELEVFTKVIERWDKGCVDQLPTYLREYWEIMYNVVEELEDDLAKLGRINYVDYLRREVIQLSKAYLQEAYWREAKYVPPYEEYFENALKSTAMNVIVALSLLDNEVEESVARETFDIVFTYGKPERAACIIARGVDDIVDYEFDKQRNHVVGAVDCYMNQYGASKEEACAMINAAIEDAWKDLTEEIFLPTTPIPMPLLMRIYNACRVCDYVYKYDNGYSLISQRIKATLTLLFVDPLF